MPEPVALHEVVQDVTMDLAPSTAAVEAPFFREERIQRGDTVASLLARLQVDDADAERFLRASPRARSLYQLVPGRSLRAVTSPTGELMSLRYVNGDRELRVDRQGPGFLAVERPLELERRLVMSSGEIETSLFAALDAAGLGDHIATQLADIFSGEIDFSRDLHPGDHFSIVFEALYHDGEFVRTGRIMGSEVVARGRSHQAFYFADTHGGGSYYSGEGRNLRRAFLRSPLEFSRITSGFSSSRLHPVLNVWRAHRGVDYAAPVGTRVRSTADGEVVFAGRQSGYGNVVVIRHRGGYATAYGHLSGYARGIHAGQRVAQGDVIGYVGMTGLATGPHLHYEFRINGVHQDPLRVATPGGEPITPARRPQFDASVADLSERLNLIRGTNLALVN